MKTHEIVILNQDVEAIEIPTGNRITLFKGTRLTIVQSVGGSFTVMTDQGAMSSVRGKDAAALGKEVQTPKAVLTPHPENATTEELVWAQLKTCYDPEIPYNIVDLGLIYDCKLSALDQQGHQRADIRMTLTAPGCGMGDFIKEDVRMKVLTVPGIKECYVEMTFDPPWDTTKMNPALRRSLNMI